VEITWLGHVCVRVRTKQATVLMDPYERSAGLDMGRPTADIVTISHDHPMHGHVPGVKGDPLVINGPGEYEVQGVQILGVATSLRPAEEGAKPERNIVYLIEAEGLHVVQLGGIGVQPTAEDAEPLSNVDILILPIGEGTLEPEQAARTVRMLEPAIAIPVGYRPDGMEHPRLKAFLAAVGVEPEPPVSKLSIQGRAGSGDTLRIVLLESRG
jgi:L-ascorbate metabolism protein UlaG (beta-lactamase superfamily)